MDGAKWCGIFGCEVVSGVSLCLCKLSNVIMIYNYRCYNCSWAWSCGGGSAGDGTLRCTDQSLEGNKTLLDKVVTINVIMLTKLLLLGLVKPVQRVERTDNAPTNCEMNLKRRPWTRPASLRTRPSSWLVRMRERSTRGRYRVLERMFTISMLIRNLEKWSIRTENFSVFKCDIQYILEL